MNHCKKLIDFLLNDYSRNRLSFLYGAWIALFGHSFYGILWKYTYNQPHEDMNLRIICASLFLPYIFTKYLKDRNWLKVFFSVYWYFCLIINLPFIFTYLTLMNNFSGLWLICETMMILVTIILMPNFITFIIVFSSGILLAYILYLLNSNRIIDFHERIYLEYLLLMPMVIGGSILINSSSKIGEINLKVEEEKSRIFKSLAASIAHELRNPLNMINMIGLQIRNLMNDINTIKNKNSSSKSNAPHVKIDKNYNDDLDENNEINSSIKLKLIEYTNHITDAIKNANTIINAILSDINEKKISESSFSYMQPKDMINKIIKTYGYKNELEKTKILTILPRNSEENFIFKAFPERFTYVIFNLIKNSFYYLGNFPNSNIIIGTEKNRIINSKAYNTIFVYDTGPGISEEILPSLFNDFFTFGKEGGTGLGLAFCKRNMFLLGGDIICESKFGGFDENGNQLSGWTKFSLLFPIIDKSLHNLNKISKTDVDDNFNKVLLVDEGNEDNLLLLKNKIEKAFPSVICDTSATTTDAYKTLNSDQLQYELVLIDIDNSKIEGIEFAKKIRAIQNKEISNTPIIVMTPLDKKTFFQITPKLDSKSNLFNCYVNKSSNDNFLYRSISKWLFNLKDELDYLGSKEDYIDILQNKKALFADDQKINLIITKKILESFGLIVTEVNNGRELVESFQKSLDDNGKSSFDIILTDISMPPFNGDKASKEIRAIEAKYADNLQNNDEQNQENISEKNEEISLDFSDENESKITQNNTSISQKNTFSIPIIATTGDSGKENFINFFDCGIDDYFIKGENTEILIKMIAHYLQD